MDYILPQKCLSYFMKIPVESPQKLTDKDFNLKWSWEYGLEELLYALTST